MSKTSRLIISAAAAACLLCGCGGGTSRNQNNQQAADSAKTTCAASAQAVILDTDLGSSTDDVVLMACLYNLMDQGTVDLKAIMVNREGATNAKLADIMNTYYKHAEIPIGLVKNGKKDPRVFIDYWKMAESKTYTDEPEMPRSLSDSEIAQLPDACQLYRKTLSEAKDSSVTIFSIGFATNLAHLLESGPDSISRLSGIDLVKNKVKAIYLQAGHFGKGLEPDYNFSQDPEHATILMKLCPAPMYFSPQESGDLFNYEIPDMLQDLEESGNSASPLYHCYKHHNCDTGQRMWDAITMLQWLHPDLFDTHGPTDIFIDEGMVIHEGDKSETSNRYWQFPKETTRDSIMTLLRKYTVGKEMK